MVVRELDNIEKMEMQLRRLSNIYKNKFLYSRLSSEVKNILDSNIKFKNKYKGKRCFILGNGPSVNKVDFSKLENELVITVNDMVRHKDFCDLKSNFHFLVDPAYFKMNKGNIGEAEFIEKTKLLTKNDTILFMLYYAKDIVKKYGWQKINIHYFINKLYFYDNYKEKIDFSTFVPEFYGVIHYCIIFAIYLGCKEINLLGCDATNIIADLLLLTNKQADFAYAFDLSKEASDIEKKKHRSFGLEYTLYVYWKHVHTFLEMRDYCKRNGVDLYNCSEESILDCLPKRKIEDLLS